MCGGGLGSGNVGVVVGLGWGLRGVGCGVWVCGFGTLFIFEIVSSVAELAVNLLNLLPLLPLLKK